MSMPEPHRHGEATGRKAGVVIASTRAAAGVYEDLTGPVIIDWLTRARVSRQAQLLEFEG